LTKGVRSSKEVVVVRSVGTPFDEVKVTWKVNSDLREVAYLRPEAENAPRDRLGAGPSFSAQTLVPSL
jgi:hypothetical protein